MLRLTVRVEVVPRATEPKSIAEGATASSPTRPLPVKGTEGTAVEESEAMLRLAEKAPAAVGINRTVRTHWLPGARLPVQLAALTML